MSDPALDLRTLARLRRQCRLVWVGAAPFLAGGLWLWHALGGMGAALQAGLQTAAVMGYLWVRTQRLLALNHRPGETHLRPDLGTANTLTLVRAALIALLAGFIFQPAPDPARAGAWALWLPALLYLTAVILDAADGAIARATGSGTRLGERLDTEVDALGLLTASALAVWVGRAPVFYLAAGLGYYLVQAAVGLRRVLGRPVFPVSPRAEARTVAGCAMGFAVAILAPAFEAPAFFPAALAITAALILGFAKDWLIAGGWASSEGRLIRPSAAAAQRLIEKLLPLALRAGVALGLLLIGWDHPGDAARHALSAVEQAVLGGAALMAALGVAARLASVALVLVTAEMTAGGLAGPGAALVATGAALLILTGAGRLRLWQPEDYLFTKRVGDRKG